jgi:16S rRNA (uracil1498-N3)-methyltransferase
VRRRFFVEQFDEGHAVMEGEAAYHLGRVLRAERGQVYELSDGNRVWLARVEEVKHDRIGFSLVEEVLVEQPSLQTTLLLSILKFDAFELALEKATELGVCVIVPLAAARSEKALLTATPKRAERWKRILLEAAQQSRRLRIPTLAPLTKPDEAFAARSESQKILLSERPDAPSLRNILEGTSAKSPTVAVALAIGPEGGWTDAEFEFARKHGFREGSLGRLILRAETAVIAALASVNCTLSRQES